METLTTMETKTLDELKLMASAKLPDIIQYVPFSMDGDIEQPAYFHYKNKGQDEITEDRWPYIVHLLEEKMEPSIIHNDAKPDWVNYVMAISKLNTAKESNIHTGYEKRLRAMHNSGFLKD